MVETGTEQSHLGVSFACLNPFFKRDAGILLLFLLILSCTTCSKRKAVILGNEPVSLYEMSVHLKEATFDRDKKVLHVSGRITDEIRNEGGLSGAYVAIRADKPDITSHVIKATDKGGWFNLQFMDVEPTDILTFSFIGYKSIEYSVRDIHRVSKEP